MSRRKITTEFKYEILKAWEDGLYSLGELSKQFKVDKSSIQEWKYKFAIYGIEGLNESTTWTSYTKELKLAAVCDYLSGEYSLREVTKKYQISNKSVLRKWIKKYNGHRELIDTGKGRRCSMTKGRKTTWKERIEIVEDALANGKNYHETSEKYQVSYQQVYQWVHKYEDGGLDALKDKRGRNKSKDELTPEEKMKLEMRRIEKENERLRAENAFLKKLEEIERRRT